jgi:N utilization substance protein A
MRGSRVQSVVNELHGEKIDIVNWSEDTASLVVSALAPAEIQKVIIDDQIRKIEVILSEENLSKAIGRRGQNVRLASKLIDYEIDILTEKEESEKRQSEFKDKTEIFIKGLEVDETLGQLLVAEGFSSIQEINQSSLEDISKIEAIDENTAKELKERANDYLKKEKEDIGKKLKLVLTAKLSYSQCFVCFVVIWAGLMHSGPRYVRNSHAVSNHTLRRS